MLHDLAVHHLWKSQLLAGGVDAVYLRGNESLQLRIVPGRHRPQQYGAEYEEVTADASDWLVLACDLVFGGQEVKPARGDRIVVGEVTHEVVHQGEVDPWRFVDQTRAVLRVFTQEGQANG